MKKNIALIMIITIFAKITGFARDITLASVYGVSAVSDAYLIAITIPSVFFMLVGTGVITSYIPMYNRIKEREGINLANRFTSNVINLTTLLSIVLIFLIFLFTDSIVKVFAFGFQGETLKMTVSFTRITILSIAATGGLYVYKGYLESNNSFVVPALIGLPSNLIIIISIFMSSIYGMLILPIGNMVSIYIQLAILFLFVSKLGYKYTNNFRIDKNIKDFFLLSIPVVIGISVNQINTIVDRTIASSIIVGGVSALNYSNQLIVFIQSIFVLAILIIIYPLMTKLIINKETDAFRKIISESITYINLFLMPITIGTLVLSKPIVQLLFARGAFDNNAIILTSESLFYYSIGIIGIGLREVVARAFYSMEDTRTPMINAAIGMVVNIILNIILSQIMGIAGLALATSISALFTAVLMIISLYKKIGDFGIKNIIINFLKIFLISTIMGVAVLIINNGLSGVLPNNILVIVSILMGVFIYALLAINMRIIDLHKIMADIKFENK